MDINNILLGLGQIITVVLVLSFWVKKDKSSINTSVSNWLVGGVFISGLVILGEGIGSLSYAGAINAILVFESAKEPIAQVAFDHLHSLLDPALARGHLFVFLGSISLAAILTTGFTKLRR